MRGKGLDGGPPSPFFFFALLKVTGIEPITTSRTNEHDRDLPYLQRFYHFKKEEEAYDGSSAKNSGGDCAGRLRKFCVNHIVSV
jgi:hypothetical protein